MTPAAIQLIVLAGVAIFLILKLKNILGTREGFEKPPLPSDDAKGSAKSRSGFEVIEGGPDPDITDHVDADSDAAKALGAMKSADPSFGVTDFLQGARGAYEMILMSFEKGDMDAIVPFLSAEVFEGFSEVVDAREKEGLTVEATFVGIRELVLMDAEFDKRSKEGEVKVKFVGELTSLVRDSAGDVIEGNANDIKRQKDIWTFARIMGSDDPNWKLVATGG